MSYVVLARKWRPQHFEDLVGQDHVARTLGNAINSGRVAHAFLFTGVRGVGKTTSARILAKALNCMGKPGTVPPGTDPGPTVSPCLECPACLEITAGTDMDVREIDGASYNGVDEVRKLQDSLPYRPNRDRYKIVIVDEVHMLTQAAWNAFLKTLEEPPPHVKFIFATTEVHKVPITILSRVQRFDFKMIQARTIAQRLKYVLEQEKIAADETSIAILARQAAGSMRDAMSLLDQVIAFSGESLVGEDVARVLGVASRSALHKITRALVQGEPETCLRLVGEIADQGFDIPHVAQDLLARLRDLVVARVCGDPKDLLDLSDEEQADVITLAKEANENDLIRLHQGFSKNFDEVVRGSDPRASLEMLLVRLAVRPPLLPVDELLHRLAHLEKRLSEGGARPARAGSPSAPRPKTPEPSAPQRDPRERGHKTERADAGTSPDPKEDEPAPPPASTHKAAPLAAAPEPIAVPAPPTPASPPPAHVPSAPAPAAPPPPKTSPPPAFQAPQPQSSTPPSVEASSLPALSAEERATIARFFPVSEKIRETDKLLASYFEQTVPLSWNEEQVELGLESHFIFEKQLTTKESLEIIEAALRAEFSPNIKLRITTNSKEALPHRTLAAERVRQRQAKHEAALEDVRTHPKVQEAIRLLSADLKTVRLPES